MKRIRAIYNSLSRQEQRYLKSFLQAFHVKGSNKALALVQLLEQNPSITQHEASLKLYGNPKSKAFIMLKARLLEKMQETLSLTINLQNNDTFQEDPAAYEVIAILKQLIYALMLRKRGLEEIAREIFEKCEEKAFSAGLPEFRLPPLIYLQNISASQQSGAWEYSGEIQNTLNQYETDILGIGIFDEFNLRTRTHVRMDQEHLNWLHEKIDLLETRLRQHYTVRTHYFYVNLLVSYYEGIQDFVHAREALEELIVLISANKGLRSKNRLGTPYIKLASIECGAYNFEAALDAAIKARDLYDPRKYNYFSATIYGIFTLLYLGQLAEARTLINDLSWFRIQKRRIHSIELSYYLESCLNYLEGNTKEAFQILGQLQGILVDKKGWNSGIRIFEIMLLIDMDLWDLASSRIENLRKHLSRYEGDPRHARIFRILYLLDKNAFDFRRQNTEIEQLILSLKTTYTWQAISHELIRFDVWMGAKKKKINIQKALRESFQEKNKINGFKALTDH